MKFAEISWFAWVFWFALVGFVLFEGKSVTMGFFDQYQTSLLESMSWIFNVTWLSVIDIVSICFQAHTILLVQPSRSPESRTYSDYESLTEMLEGICRIYEEHLKRNHPKQPSITYDISQLFDIVCNGRLLHTISHNCLILLISSQTSAALCKYDDSDVIAKESSVITSVWKLWLVKLWGF